MNSLSQVKFCNGHAYRVPGKITRLQDYGLRLNENYNLLTEKHTQIMCKYPFMWSIIPKGLAYYIYISHLEGTRVTYFIERKIQEKTKRARIFVMRDIFPNVPSETIFSGYTVCCKVGVKWKIMLQDIQVEKGEPLYGSYVKRWEKMTKYLENAKTSNKTVSWKILPLFRFPVSIDIVRTLEINEGIRVQRLGFYNMSENGKKRYLPFYVKYELTKNENVVVEEQQNNSPKEKGGNQLDYNRTYRMKMIPNEQVPDVYQLEWNGNIIGTACVRTIRQSHYMRNLISRKKDVASFEYNPLFHSWEIKM